MNQRVAIVAKRVRVSLSLSVVRRTLRHGLAFIARHGRRALATSAARRLLRATRGRQDAARRSKRQRRGSHARVGEGVSAHRPDGIRSGTSPVGPRFVNNAAAVPHSEKPTTAQVAAAADAAAAAHCRCCYKQLRKSCAHLLAQWFNGDTCAVECPNAPHQAGDGTRTDKHEPATTARTIRPSSP